MNYEPMVAALGSHLAAIGVDAADECRKTRLVLISNPKHLGRNQVFNIERLFQSFQQMLDDALQDHFSGLFGSGDMAWEFGPKKDFSKLFEYEWRMERFFRERPQVAGICQYHADTLPQEALRTAAIAHETIFVDETISVPNPNYIGAHIPHRRKGTHLSSSDLSGQPRQLSQFSSPHEDINAGNPPR